MSTSPRAGGRFGHHAIEVSLARHVGADSNRLDAVRFRQLASNFRDAIFAPRNQSDVGARNRESLCAFDAESGRSAGYQRAMTFQ